MKPVKHDVEWPHIAVYDIESVDWVNPVLVCHVDEYGNRVHFKTVDEYVTWLFTSFKGSHVWAHAGGRYDHRFLIPIFYDRGWDFKAAISGDSIVILTVTGPNKRKIHFADSYRLMPNALKAIGKTIKLEKLDVDRSRIDTLSEAENLEYCFRDCDIALKGLQYMRSALTAVNADFAFTLASVATRWVRRSDLVDFNRFYRPNGRGSIHYDPMMREADAWCAPAFFGGRTEMFAQGTIKGPVYYHDVVSSYPWSMSQPLPLYLSGFVPPPKSKSQSKLIEYLSYTGVTEATVIIPKCQIGPLCARHEGRLMFPYGKIVGRWTNVELMAALHRGVKIEPHYQCRFESKDFLRPFVETFYGLRRKAKKDGDEFRSYAYKILLNSLYGKLNETIDRRSYTTSRYDIERAKEEGGQVLATKIAGLYCLQTQEEGPFRHVAAGAYVTAYSRLKLMEGLESVVRRGGQIYYCDTDSIMSSIPIAENVGAELGQWQHEYTFQEAEILLPKVYKAVTDTGKTIYRCKGLPIVREGDQPYMPEKRWEAYKRYAETGDPEMARLLMSDGITGFVEDMKYGSISPRKKVLIRRKQITDKKRDWSTDPSMARKVG